MKDFNNSLRLTEFMSLWRIILFFPLNFGVLHQTTRLIYIYYHYRTKCQEEKKKNKWISMVSISPEKRGRYKRYKPASLSQPEALPSFLSRPQEPFLLKEGLSSLRLSAGLIASCTGLTNVKSIYLSVLFYIARN